MSAMSDYPGQLSEDVRSRDIEMLFAKICMDNKFKPVMSIFRKMMDKSRKNKLVVDIHDFYMNQAWV